MIIFPAIDIKGGKCVRLLKGNFDDLTQYNKSPLEQAKIFSNYGFKHLHLVDLDGALEGELANKNIIKNIAQIKNIKIQVGGGIRSLEQIEELLNNLSVRQEWKQKRDRLLEEKIDLTSYMVDLILQYDKSNST